MVRRNKFKKRFGQHLLIDKNHLRKIINAIDLKPDDLVLEIGAGTGILTKELAKCAKKIYAVEVERDVIKQLKTNVGDIQNVEIIEADFLKLDLNKIFDKPFIVVGNIPYNITSQILIKLFGEIDNIPSHLWMLRKVFLTIQLEVAKRIVADPGNKDYSPFSILVQYFTDPKILFKVPANAFYPRPNVNSAFVCFNVKEKLQKVKNPALLKNIIRTAFQQRRKKIINSINKVFTDKKVLTQKLNSLNLDQNLRAEDLEFEKYLELSNSL